MLLAHCAKDSGSIQWEFHGEPVGGECELALRKRDVDPGVFQVNLGRCPRETVKETIRAWCRGQLPGATLVFAYPGADPWPPGTLELLAEAREALGLGPDEDGLPADLAEEMGGALLRLGRGRR